ncbi:hypothetical protein ABW21_db0200236 [Orbilia brochopaga]|nr:hypothetical protein ABW21_db0200236 [Drechslerella brochopaga]
MKKTRWRNAVRRTWAPCTTPIATTGMPSALFCLPSPQPCLPHPPFSGISSLQTYRICMISLSAEDVQGDWTPRSCNFVQRFSLTWFSRLQTPTACLSTQVCREGRKVRKSGMREKSMSAYMHRDQRCRIFYASYHSIPIIFRFAIGPKTQVGKLSTRPPHVR